MLGGRSGLSNQYGELAIYRAAAADGDIAGLLYHKTTGRAWRFTSLVQMINIGEAVFDAENYPQKTHELRELIAGERDRIDEQLLSSRAAPLPTPEELAAPDFIVRVRYRQNASWQGTVSWGDRTRPFRCAIELVKLLDAALNPAGTVDWGV